MVIVLLSAPFRKFSVSRIRDLFLLPSKVHADALNDLQYCSGKMTTKSKMYLNIGTKFVSKRNTSTNTDN